MDLVKAVGKKKETVKEDEEMEELKEMIVKEYKKEMEKAFAANAQKENAGGGSYRIGWCYRRSA